MPGPPRRPADTSAAANGRNEYIPTFITKKPFFLDSAATDDYLEHQRLQQQTPASLSKIEDRSKRVIHAATKFRKGACKNCGALGHTHKDCLYRARKEGAKWTGLDIRPDEERDAKDVTNWDAKRDQYATYDPSEYTSVVEEASRMEKLRRAQQLAADSGDLGAGTTTVGGSEKDGDLDVVEGARYEEETDMGRNQPTSTRNLRIREDVAPYLRSLDPDSAKYDPKSRRMLDAGALADQAAELVAEQGFQRASGERTEFEQAQRLAWETQKLGGAGGGGSAPAGLGVGPPGMGGQVGIPGDRIHLQANPTHAQKLIETRNKEAAEKRERRKRELLEQYGGANHFKTPLLDDGSASSTSNERGLGTLPIGMGSKVAGIVETDRFIEYDPDTGLPKIEDGGEGGKKDKEGADKNRPKRKSKYQEDVFVNNHTCVWGSWWSDARWGFQCCYSTVKNSYCTGPAGREVWEEERRRKLGLLHDGEDGDGDSGEGDAPRRRKRADDGADDGAEEQRRKKANSNTPAVDAHEAVMEEYRKEKMRRDDPLWKP